MMALYLISLCVLLTQAPTSSAFRSTSSIRGSTHRRHGVNPISMGIDTSGLNLLPDQGGLLNAAVGSTNTWTDASNALIVLGGLAYLANEKRPRGSARDDLIEMKKSTIPTANFGAFSKKFIPKGTTIGRYPGFLRSMADALSSKSSDEARKASQSYFFSVDEDQVLDPTNALGDLEDSMKFLGVISVSTLIARINEPPLGGDVNLCTEIVANGVIVTAERDIFPGEELFMDYGPDYNRSNYIMPTPSATPSTRTSSKNTDNDTDTDDDVKGRGVRSDKEEEKKGSDSDMFGRSVIETPTPTLKQGTSTPTPPTLTPPVPAPVRVPASVATSSASMFDSLIGNSQTVGTTEDFNEGKITGNSKGILADGTDTVQEIKGELTDAPQYRPALSIKESEKLLESLDDMTDAEVAAVLSKLKAAVSERIKSEVSDALLNKSDKKSVSDTVDSKKMPRAPPVDPEMRKKYKTELDAIENELDRIYSDPLGVWQEFMANPEKFLEENETGLAEDEDLQ